jgi:hypothetical protein
MHTLTSPMSKDSLVPKITLVRISLPNKSVPIKCALEGGCLPSPDVTAMGSYGATQLANKAISTKKIRTADPITAPLFFEKRARILPVSLFRNVNFFSFISKRSTLWALSMSHPFAISAFSHLSSSAAPFGPVLG